MSASGWCTSQPARTFLGSPERESRPSLAAGFVLLQKTRAVVNRTIFIGDVHSCARELEALLEHVDYSREDSVCFVGDLLARGPDANGVLRIYREIHARAVLGNHEDRLLEARAARAGGAPGPRLSPSHEAVLRELSDDDWALLESWPLYLDLPAHGVRVVHAGVVPGVPIARQRRRDLLKMRALDPDGSATTKWRKRSWAEDYHEDPHVVFGHNAMSGLQIYANATGLDSGCVYGGRLTAMVLAENQPPPPVAGRDEVLFSVPARRRYVDFGPRFPDTASK